MKLTNKKVKIIRAEIVAVSVFGELNINNPTIQEIHLFPDGTCALSYLDFENDKYENFIEGLDALCQHNFIKNIWDTGESIPIDEYLD
jgi:hypothetical protein